MTYHPCRSTILQNFSTIAQTVYEICVTKVFHFLAHGGLIPGPKFTKRGEDLADNEFYHPAKFHRSMPTRARDILYKILRTHTHTHTHTHTKQTNKQTSTPVNPTGVYPHMPIADCRSPRNTGTKSLQHRPSPTMRRLVSHTVRDGSASLSHRDNTVLPLRPRSPKGEVTYYLHVDLPSYKISARSHKRCTRYALPKCFTFWC